MFFLGAFRYMDPATGTFGMTGFGKDPVNPFTNSLASDPNYGGKPTRCTAPTGSRRCTSSTAAGFSSTPTIRRPL